MPSVDVFTLSPLPAPVWFIEFFKALGFILHMLMMHLWLVAFPLALALGWAGCAHGKKWAARMVRQMPIIITFGVNFGIVPLLFIQVLYPRAFYPATILMGWGWLMIIWLLIPAYYGVYLYMFAVKKDPENIPGWKYFIGWVSAIMFLMIGFFFVNGLTLTASPGMWEKVWLDGGNEMAGATLGLGSALGHPSFFARWMLMFGLAFGTVAVWTLADASLFLRKHSPLPITPEYRAWAGKFACCCALFGATFFTLFGAYYVFGTWTPAARDAMFGEKMLPVTILAACGPGLTALAVCVFSWFRSAWLAMIPFLVQIVSLTGNALARQGLQVFELYDYLDITRMKIDWEIPGMILFLVTFVVGVLVVAWMVYEAAKAMMAAKT